MVEIITKINRERGFNYRIDKEGNVLKERYNWLKDPYTLVTIAIILLGLLFYIQISDMKTTEKNFESSCLLYMDLRERWMIQNPGEEPTLEQVFSLKKQDLNIKR